MIKKKICILLSVIACFCLGAAVLMNFVPKTETVSAAVVGYGENDIKMIDKASVRVKARNGIRFATFIGNNSPALNAEYWETHEMGTMFIPKKFMKDGDELVLGGTYSGKKPAVAEFNGDVTKFQVDTKGVYTDGKLFNTVIELTNVTAASAFNAPMVARTYIKDTTTGVVTYLDAVEKAPAYVASSALDADSLGGDETYDETEKAILDTYVKFVKIGGEVKDANVSVNDDFQLGLSVNVDGLAINYTADKGVVSGNRISGVSNEIVTVTASVAGGKLVEEFKLAIIDKQELERKYYAEADADQVNTTDKRNSENKYFIIKAFNVENVIYNGKTLSSDDFKYDSAKNQLEIVSSVLVSAKIVNTLTIKSSTHGNVTVSLILKYDSQEELPESFDYFQDLGFNVYSYHSVRDSDIVKDEDGTPGGTLTESDSGIDFYQESYISDYYESGMELLLGQAAAGISSMELHPNLESAVDLKNTLDKASTLGYNNSVIVTDGILIDIDRSVLEGYYGYDDLDEAGKQEFRNKIIYGDSTTYPSLIGEGRYADTAALDKVVEEAISRYCFHPAFGGLMLRDEPQVAYLPLVAEIYQSVQRVYAKLGLTDKKIIVNLFPLYPGNKWAFPGNTGESNDTNYYNSYKNYLDMWLTQSGAKDLQMDIYSLYAAGTYRYHIVNLQIAAEVASKNGAKIAVVNSAWQRLGDGGERFHTYQDMQWMNNITMAYGASNFGYYTYHTLNDASNQVVKDGASMVTRAGLKTEIYDYAREINSKAQILAPVILNFDYVKGAYYNNLTDSDVGLGGSTSGWSSWFNKFFGTDDTLKDDAQKSIYTKTEAYTSSNYSDSKLTVDNENFAGLSISGYTSGKYSWLINELYDSKNGNTMYAVMNTIDSLAVAPSDNTYKLYGKEEKTITLTFSGDVDKVWVFRDGRFTIEPLDNGAIEFKKMIAGDCVYVIPFKYSAKVDNDNVATPDWGDDSWNNESKPGDDNITTPDGWGDNAWGNIVQPGTDTDATPDWGVDDWGILPGKDTIARPDWGVDAWGD